MEITDLNIEESQWSIPEDYANNISKMELEENLDNLGYIFLDRNNQGDEVSIQEIANGIKRFRCEYRKCFSFFEDKKELFDHLFSPEILKLASPIELTEEELNFFDQVTSLEGQFLLHKFKKDEILSHLILKRVLKYRLSILDQLKLEEPDDNKTKEEQEEQERQQIELALKKIGKWTQISNYSKKIELTGALNLLIDKLVNQEQYDQHKYRHVAYFFDNSGKLGRIDMRGKARERFLWRFKIIPGGDSTKAYFQDIFNDKDKIKEVIDDELNSFMCRIVQIKLWLLGTYEGKLDTDIGPVTVDAIRDFIAYLHEIQGKRQGPQQTANNKSGISFYDILLKVQRKGYYALNVTFLLKYIFPILIEKENLTTQLKTQNDVEEKKVSNATIAEEIAVLSEKFDENKKKEFYEKLEKLIDSDQDVNAPPKSKKRKTRGGREFFKSVKLFFQKVVRFIKKGVEKIIDFFKRLFQKIKNGIKILLREIKKVFQLLKNGFQFMFGKRKVKTPTDSQQTAILTDYDSDFDSITNYTNVNSEVIKIHIQKIQEITKALESAASFLGHALYLIIQVIQPGGWLRMGVQLLKFLASKLFNFQRFSFPF